MKNFKVAGFGELLWDIFPDQKRLGGAPANFAGHYRNLGGQGFVVSAIGHDEDGGGILSHFDSRNYPTDYIVRLENFPTGCVLVELDTLGQPSYEICRDTAWDNIELTESQKELARDLDAVCFGSLAQRSALTRAALKEFLALMKPGSLKIFDINLRQDFFSEEIIKESFLMANILKISDEELPVVSQMLALEGGFSEQLKSLRDQFDLDMIVYTRGGDGSLLMTKNDESDDAGRKVELVDAVGAGDSFTAAMCMGVLKGWPLDRINAFANDVASFVCSNHGATPQLPVNLIQKCEAKS